MTIDDYRKRLVRIQKGLVFARKKGYDILLEYSEEQKSFHFNYLKCNGRLYDKPTKYFMPIGYTDSNTFERFRETINYTETLEEIETKYKEFYD